MSLSRELARSFKPLDREPYTNERTAAERVKAYWRRLGYEVEVWLEDGAWLRTSLVNGLPRR